MLRITRLKLRNFKSFRKADIPISKGFSAIVGANASGKSNIVDSLLFVFGITSLKMLRASKLTELVNHDAGDSYAKVEVELKDGDKNYVISRTVDKQGKSVVRLDGKKKGLNEVSALLAELGVRATGHNIVTQGDVTRVIETSPKQRRQLLEEIAGLTEFEEKKEEALKKLDSVDKKIKDVSLVLKERETYLEELEKERQAALEHEKLTKELKQCKATMLNLRIGKIKKDFEFRNKRIEESGGRIESAKKENEKLGEEEQKLEETISATTDKIIEASQSTSATLRRAVEEQRASVRISDDRISGKKYALSKAHERKSDLKDKAARLREKLKEKEEIANKKSREQAQLEKDIGPLEEKRRKGMEAAREREKELEGKEAELKRLRGELLEQESKMLGLTKNVAEFEKEISLLQKRADTLSGEENKELRERLKGIDSVKGRISVAGELIANTVESIAGLKNEVKSSELAEKIEGNLEKLAELREQIENELVLVSEALSSVSGEKELEEIKGQSQDAINALEGLQREMSESTAVVEGLRKEIDAAEERLSKSRKDSAGVSNLEDLNELKEKLSIVKSESAGLKVQKDELRKRLEEAETEASQNLKDIENLENAIKGEEASLEKMKKELEGKEAELGKATRANTLLEEEKQRLTTKVKNIGEKRGELSREVERLTAELNELRIEQTRDEVRITDLEQEYINYKEVELLQEIKLHEVEQRVPEIEKAITKLGAINMKAIEGVGQYSKEVAEVREKADKLEEERQAVLNMIDKIDVKKMNVFMKCFEEINKNFNRIYYSFFGGEGRLGLTDQENPLEGGLTIEAKYKEGVLKSIDAMSGGEKALTALAFLFSVQSYDPAPFYIFDEADAALDMANSVKLAKLVKDVSKGAQFISITHNNAVTKEADQLIGVALNKQKSSVIGLRLRGRIENEDTQVGSELHKEEGLEEEKEAETGDGALGAKAGEAETKENEESRNNGISSEEEER